MKKWIISIIVVLASLGILCGCGTNVPKGWDTYQLGDKIEYSFAPDWEIIEYGLSLIHISKCWRVTITMPTARTSLRMI